MNDKLNITRDSKTYTLSSCSGTTTIIGRRIKGLCVKSYDQTITFNLQEVIKCGLIPSTRFVIPNSDVASLHPHLERIARLLPDYVRNVNVKLLIARDLSNAHHVYDQIIDNRGEPFAQGLHVGWVVIGKVCIGKVHPRVNKTTFSMMVVVQRFLYVHIRSMLRSPSVIYP